MRLWLPWVRATQRAPRDRAAPDRPDLDASDAARLDRFRATRDALRPRLADLLSQLPDPSSA